MNITSSLRCYCKKCGHQVTYQEVTGKFNVEGSGPDSTLWIKYICAGCNKRGLFPVPVKDYVKDKDIRTYQDVYKTAVAVCFIPENRDQLKFEMNNEKAITKKEIAAFKEYLTACQNPWGDLGISDQNAP